MEYKVIEGGGITSPKGFTAGAVYVGVKSRKTQKPDVAVLYSETEASCAAVFTTNKFCAAPVILDREILKNGKAKAIRFSTLEAICRELNCQPGDIIEYRPEETTE